MCKGRGDDESRKYDAAACSHPIFFMAAAISCEVHGPHATQKTPPLEESVCEAMVCKRKRPSVSTESHTNQHLPCNEDDHGSASIKGTDALLFIFYSKMSLSRVFLWDESTYCVQWKGCFLVSSLSNRHCGDQKSARRNELIALAPSKKKRTA